MKYKNQIMNLRVKLLRKKTPQKVSFITNIYYRTIIKLRIQNISSNFTEFKK